MIEDKEKYRNECSRRFNKIQDLIKKKTFVEDLVNEFGDASITDISRVIEEELSKEQKAYEDFTKEENDALTAIDKKYDSVKIINMISNGVDTLDMVNMYLSGEL